MPGFLILYRRHSGERQVLSYDGPDGRQRALLERLRLEADGRFKDSDIEIAAVSSDSIETVKATHARYFNGDEIDFLAMAGQGC